jgi:FG-GAP-like repeat
MVLAALIAAVAGAAVPARASSRSCGSTWSLVDSPNLTGPNMLNAVSVVSPTDIWSVGNYLPGANYRTLIQHWDGTAWSVVTSPNVGRKDNSLTDVVALGSDDIWAVGYSHGTNRVSPATLAEHWDGASWVVVTTMDASNRPNLLVSVAGAASNDVWAVGSYDTRQGVRQTLAEHFDGTEWTISPTPNTGALSALTAVAVASADSVWAIGYALVDDAYQTLVEHWDGTDWTVMPSPTASGNNVLVRMGLTSDSDLWAVGYAEMPFADRTLGLHWNGSSWSGTLTRDLPSAVSVLLDVAVEPDSAWAVGFFFDGKANVYRSMSERWDGRRWAAVPTPRNPGGDQLKGVDVVPDTGQVWAVGLAGDETLVETICPGLGPASPAAAAVRPAGSRTTHLDPAGVPPALGTRSHAPGPRDAGPAASVHAVDDAIPAGLYQELQTWSAAVTDLDENGWPDIFIGGHLGPGHLYLNEGGVFSEIDAGAFKGKDRHDCAWADVDQDGLIDLFCSVGAEHGLVVKGDDLEVQQPDRTFVEQTAAFSLLNPFGRGRHLTFIDVNHDPYPDLFVQDFDVRGDGLPSPNRLYINSRGTKFRYEPSLGFAATAGEGCAQAVDYDGDGWQDLMFCGQMGQGLRLFRNEEGKAFTDVTASSGIVSGGVAGAVMVDLNGDGAPDLAHVSPGRLTIQLQQGGVFTTQYTRALSCGNWVAPGDADGDGRPDLYVVEGGRSCNSNPPDVMLLNGGDGTSFTQLDTPQTDQGCGDVAYAIDHNLNGFTDFVVLNGCGPTTGPVQLISFYADP